MLYLGLLVQKAGLTSMDFSEYSDKLTLSTTLSPDLRILAYVCKAMFQKEGWNRY